MKRFLIYSAILMFVSASCSVQNNIQKTEPFLFTIESNPVSKEEFKYAFLKNFKPNDTISAEKEVNDYLDLYIRFKLKVKEARALGYDQREKYIKELSSYQKDLAKPYLTENKVTDELINEAYERMKQEVKASHILISAKEDTTAAKKKILEIKALAESGHSFDSLAAIYSTDPSAKSNGGNLGYFSSMQMVYPFESAAYNTDVNRISEVVNTSFGYHILKVYDKRPSQGKVKVAHIMLRSSKTTPQEEDLKNKEKIEAIYAEAIAGKEWDQLVKDFSQDARSKNKGGELPWISTGNFVPDFEAVAYSIKEKDEISKPFKTIYGWHVVKLLDKKGIEPLEKVKSEITGRIKKDSRSLIKSKEVLNRLKTENDFKKNQENISGVLELLDRKDTVSIKSDLILFNLQNKSYKATDFISYLNSTPSPEKDNEVKYNQFQEKSILAYESEQLEVKYPDYANLLNEYRDGILLFDIMEEKVWRKASQDTTGLRSFYEDNKSNYTKYNVKEVVIYSSNEDSAIKKVESLLKNGYEKKSILDSINSKKPLLLQSNSGIYEKGDNKLVDLTNGEEYFITSENGKHYLIHTIGTNKEIVPKLSDIKGKLISDYQDELEERWIQSLKAKYPVKTNDRTLKEVINEVERM